MDAIDQILALRVGDKFRLRGREYMLESYEGWTHYADGSLVPVWNSAKEATHIKVQPTDLIEVL